MDPNIKLVSINSPKGGGKDKGDSSEIEIETKIKRFDTIHELKPADMEDGARKAKENQIRDGEFEPLPLFKTGTDIFF